MVHYPSLIDEYVDSLMSSKTLGSHVVYKKIIPPKPEVRSSLNKIKSPPIKAILDSFGIDSLYSHQIRAIDAIRKGQHIVIATPTASGKTMIYNLPVLENIMNRPESRAYIYFR